MKYLLYGLLLALGATACSQAVKQEAEPPRQVKQYTIEQFYDNKRISGGSFSADGGKILVSSNETGIYNLYELPVDGSPMRQLTSDTANSVFAISYFPQDERVLYSADNGGDEINHIFLRNTDGTTEDLTPWESAKSQFFGWAQDEKSFFFTSNKRNPQFFDLFEMDLASMQAKPIYEQTGELESISPSAISDDKKHLALTKANTTSDNNMYLYSLESGELALLSEHTGTESYQPLFFSADSRYLYYTTDKDNEFSYLARYDLQQQAHETVFEDSWDVAFAYESKNRKYRVIGINADARTLVKVFDNETGQEVDFPKFPGAEIGGISFSHNEKLMKFTVGSSKSPSDIFVYNFETGEHRQLTNVLNPEIAKDDLVEGEVVRYASFDGTEIPALLYKPHQATAESKVPAMVWVHGGPGGQSRLNYFPLVQYLVNQGYAIIAVNNRGSSGYGKTFYQMDDRNHGEGDLMDCVKAKDFLATTGWVDTTKIGIIGGSYGGYMTMAAMTFQPEAFEVGVNIFGVTNWLRTLRSIPPWWGSFRDALYQEMGDPNTEDSVRLHKISPLFHAENVQNPVMVLQGANDPRVLQVESDEIVEKLKQNEVPVEYVLFEDEGHGFVKKENEIEGYGKIKLFLDKHLKGEQPAAEI